MAIKIINVSYKVDSKEWNGVKAQIQGVEKETKDAEKEMLKLGKTTKLAGQQGGQSFLNFKNILSTISVVGIIAGLTQLGKKILDLGIKQEQLNISFTTFLGSASKARLLLAELTKFAIVTPFTPDQVNQAAKALLAFGVTGKEIIPTLKFLGDVSSGTGKDLTEMAIIFGQIRSTGRLMGQDLLQLINAGFNPLQIISQKTGRSVRDLKADMEKGLITFDMVEGAFKSATSAGGLFFNLMEKQSVSVGGKLSTVAGNIDEILKNIFAASEGPVKDFVDQLVKLSEAFLKLSKSGQQLVDEREDEIIKDVTKAYSLQVAVFKDSARAREKIIELIGEQKKRVEEEQAKQLGIVNSIEDERDVRRIAASEKAAMLGEEWMLYSTKIIPALEEYIIQEELAAGAVKNTADEIKLTNAQLKEREKREKALQLMRSVGKRFAKDIEEGNAEADAKELERQKAANDRSNENADRQHDYELKKLQEVEDEKNRILEEAADRRNQIQQMVQDFAIDSLQQILYATLLSDQADFNAEREKFDREILLAGDNERAKAAIRLREEQAEKQFRERQKVAEQKSALKKIAIDTAINIIRSIANNGGIPAGLPFGALAAAAGILQATIVRKLKGGEIMIDGPGTTTSDSIPAMLSKNESVINAQASQASPNLLQAINDRKLDDRILGNIAARGGSRATEIDYARLGEEFRKGKVDYDTHGYTIMKGIQKGKNFKLFIRSKVQGY